MDTIEIINESVFNHFKVGDFIDMIMNRDNSMDHFHNKDYFVEDGRIKYVEKSVNRERVCFVEKC